MGTDREWEKWGRTEPYFGVLADDKFRMANIEVVRDHFFESGRSLVSHVLSRFERRFGALERSTALDFGCGVGRLTYALSDHFADVTGLDISPSMLAEAWRNRAYGGSGNVRFALSDDSFSNATAPCDFVMSFIALQHIPPRRGLPLMQQLLERVKPGGGFMLHVSTRPDRWLGRIIFAVKHATSLGGIIVNLAKRRPLGTPIMLMHHYSADKIMRLLDSYGISEVDVVIERQSRFTTLYFSGRKPPVKID